MVSVRHPQTPRTNRHDKGKACLQVESSASQLINDTFASFFCGISSIPFNVITEFYEADAREALETMPDAWYMALWVLDTAIVTITIISRRDKSKPSIQSSLGGGMYQAVQPMGSGWFRRLLLRE